MVSVAAPSATNGLTACAHLEHAGSKGLRFSTACKQRGGGRFTVQAQAGWPQVRTALPPKREIILTPLNATYKGRTALPPKREIILTPLNATYKGRCNRAPFQSRKPVLTSAPQPLMDAFARSSPPMRQLPEEQRNKGNGARKVGGVGGASGGTVVRAGSLHARAFSRGSSSG